MVREGWPAGRPPGALLAFTGGRSAAHRLTGLVRVHVRVDLAHTVHPFETNASTTARSSRPGPGAFNALATPHSYRAVTAADTAMQPEPAPRPQALPVALHVTLAPRFDSMPEPIRCSASLGTWHPVRAVR